MYSLELLTSVSLDDENASSLLDETALDDEGLSSLLDEKSMDELLYLLSIEIDDDDLTLEEENVMPAVDCASSLVQRMLYPILLLQELAGYI